MIFFVSDNGASAEQIIRGDGHDPAAPPGSAKSYLCLGPGWSTAANTPLRLHKSWVHEGGIASPLIVHWPAGIRQARPTAAHAGPFHRPAADAGRIGRRQHARAAWHGADPPPLPGQSLVPVLAADGEISRDYLYWHHLDNRAIRVGDWKLVAAGKNPWELFNLRTDRSETKNLAAEYPGKVAELSELWTRCENQFREDAGPVVSPPEAARKPKKGGG